MLLPIKRFIDIPIMSLQTGAPLGVTSAAIIDPRLLKIVAFRVSGPRLTSSDTVLHPEDIREFSDIGFIIDGDEKLMSTEGLVRLQQVIEFKFELAGLKVENQKGRVLGKVSNYAVDPESYFIQQLYTQPTFLKSITSTGHAIHRSQIVEINNDRVIVKDATVKVEDTSALPIKDFVNPFRSSAVQPEAYSNSDMS